MSVSEQYKPGLTVKLPTCLRCGSQQITHVAGAAPWKRSKRGWDRLRSMAERVKYAERQWDKALTGLVNTAERVIPR